MKYIDAEKLIAEIKRREKVHFEDYHIKKIGSPADYGACNALCQIRSYIENIQQEQPDFPTTDEEVEKALASIPKVELPDKYKTPDWLFKQQEQPEVDFETEYAKFSNDPDALDYAFPIDLADYKDFARHFYELGLNARKEE